MVGYKQTDIGRIPDDWEVNTLGDIGKIEMCKRIFSYETNEDGEIPFYKIGTFGKEPDAFISQKLYNKYKHKFSFPKKGAILISASGTIGRTIIYDGKPSYFQDSNIVWIRNDEKLISNKLLYYVLQNVKYESEGSTIQRLYNSIIKSAKFPLPPLPEQEAIAEVLSDTDELIGALEKRIAKKRLIKQGAMQTLLTPKDDWEVKKLGEVANCFAGGTPSTFNPSYWGGDIIWLQSGKVQNKHIKNEEQLTKITKKGLNESSARLIKPNSVLVAITGATCGNIGLLTFEATANQSVVAIEPNKNFDYQFIYYSLLLNKNLILSYQTGSAQGGVNLKSVKNISLKFPIEFEQTRIATILSDMDNEIDALEKKLSKTKELKQGLMQQLLTGKIRLYYE